MKTKKSWLLAPAAIATAVVYYSFFGPPTPDPALHASVDASNVATYTVSDLPVATGTGAGNWLFLSHGDGTFFMGTPDQLALHTHQYAYNASGYKAFLEHVEVYDDNKKPPGRTEMMAISTPNSGVSPTPANIPINNNHILLKRTTNPVPGDSVTYIVVYEHLPGCAAPMSGSIRFTYDNTVFEYGKTDSFFVEGAAQVTQNGTATTREIAFSNLTVNQQRSFYIRLKTKDSLSPGLALNPATNAELQFDRSSGGTCSATETYKDTITGERVLASHDPNHKTVVQNDLCHGDSVTWRIDFQNTGSKAENLVVVSDWIDTLLEFNSVDLIDAKFTVSAIQRRPQREIRFVMPGITLRGLGEPGVQEEETRGYIVLRAKKRSPLFGDQQQSTPNWKCTAIANSARIFFGCNPPVFTETALTAVPCDSINCGPCNVMLDTVLPPTAISAPGDTLLSSAQLNALLSGTLSGLNGINFKWYPTAGLSEPFVPGPTLSGPVNRTYTLVASDPSACRQVIIRVPVVPANRLQMTAVPHLASCTSGPKWTVNAHVNGADTLNLMWRDCTTGKGHWSSAPPPMDPSKYYVAVWDTLTDDYVERWILLPPDCPNTGGGGVLSGYLGWLAALGLAVAAVVAFFVLKRKQ